MKQKIAASTLLISLAFAARAGDPENWSHAEEAAFEAYMTSVMAGAQIQKCSIEVSNWKERYFDASRRWLSARHKQIEEGRRLFLEMDAWVANHPEAGLKPVPAEQVLADARKSAIERIGGGLGAEFLRERCETLGAAFLKETR